MLRRWTWAALLFLATAPLAAQISPGPLSRPHASLEGNAHCLKCHAPSRGVSATKCLDCHTVAGFSPSRFTLQDHQKTRYPLEGAHLAVPCIACHKPMPGRSARLIQFRFPSTACATCHGDPHAGQFARSSPPLQCSHCHSVLAWSRVSFDHARARFQLEGAHRTVPCGSCHKTEAQNGQRVVRFKPLPVTCEGCHGGKRS